MEIIKFTTHAGEVYYCKAEGWNTEKLQTLVDANRESRPIYQVDILDMTEEEYLDLSATSASAEFFSGVRSE